MTEARRADSDASGDDCAQDALALPACLHSSHLLGGETHIL